MNLMLLNAEKRGLDIPEAAKIEDIQLRAGEIIAMVKADTELYSQIAV